MSHDYFIHESSYVDEDVVIGAGTKVWHFGHIQSGARIGEGCTLGQNVNIGNNVIIGNGCKIQNNVSVYEGVELEDYVFCGPSCVFTNDLTPRSKYPKGSGAYLKTVVKSGASIGANSTIVCGSTIGKWAIIGAGAVVTRAVSDYALVVGVPARQVGWVCECGEVLDRVNGCPKEDLKAGQGVGEHEDGLEIGVDDGRDVGLDAEAGAEVDCNGHRKDGATDPLGVGAGGGSTGLPDGGPSKAYVCQSCGREYIEVDSGLKEK